MGFSNVSLLCLLENYTRLSRDNCTEFKHFMAHSKFLKVPLYTFPKAPSPMRLFWLKLPVASHSSLYLKDGFRLMGDMSGLVRLELAQLTLGPTLLPVLWSVEGNSICCRVPAPGDSGDETWRAFTKCA